MELKLIVLKLFNVTTTQKINKIVNMDYRFRVNDRERGRGMTKYSNVGAR